MGKRFSYYLSGLQFGAVTALVIAGCTFDSSVGHRWGEVCSNGQRPATSRMAAPNCKRGVYEFTKKFGTDSSDWLKAFVVDKGGNYIIAGHSAGALDFGTGPLNLPNAPYGVDDAFVSKLDPQGNEIWSKRFGGGAATVESIAVDASDNSLVLTGGYSGIVNFGGDTFDATGVQSDGVDNDVFVVKLDENGGQKWSKRFGGLTSDDVGTHVSVDSHNNVIVSGYREGTFAVFFSEGLPPTPGFLLKLDAAGTVVQTIGFNGHMSGGNSSLKHTVDLTGNVFVVGSFSGHLTVDGSDFFTNDEHKHEFLMKFNAGDNLTPSWSKTFGGNIKDFGKQVAADSLGNVVVASTFEGTGDIDDCPVTAKSGSETFIMKFDAAGNNMWNRQLELQSPDFMTIVGTEHIFVGGKVDDFFASPILDGCRMWTDTWGPSNLLLMLNGEGNLIWHFPLFLEDGYGSSREFTAVVHDDNKDNSILLAGSFEYAECDSTWTEDTLNLGCGSIWVEKEIFIAKLVP